MPVSQESLSLDEARLIPHIIRVVEAAVTAFWHARRTAA
jgi:hypothetical protein